MVAQRKRVRNLRVCVCAERLSNVPLPPSFEIHGFEYNFAKINKIMPKVSHTQTTAFRNNKLTAFYFQANAKTTRRDTLVRATLWGLE